MITTHDELRAKARTTNTRPTMTDQSGAAETDLNVILQRYAQSGVLQSHGKDPIYEDWTQYPEDLRGFIEAKRSVEEHRLALPKELRDIPTEELIYMTPEALYAKLSPTQPTPAGTAPTGVQPQNAPSGT